NGSVDVVLELVIDVRDEGPVVDDVDPTGAVVGARTVAVDAVVAAPVRCASDDEEPQPAATTTAARANARRHVILRTSTTIAPVGVPLSFWVQRCSDIAHRYTELGARSPARPGVERARPRSRCSAREWAGVDSNHGRLCRQIYSLLPLA